MDGEIRHIEEPEEIRWAGDRSLLLTLRLALRVLRTDPDLAENLLALAHDDAHDRGGVGALVVAGFLVGTWRGCFSALTACHLLRALRTSLYRRRPAARTS